MMDITHAMCNTNFTFITITKTDPEIKSLSRTLTMEEIKTGRN